MPSRCSPDDPSSRAIPVTPASAIQDVRRRLPPDEARRRPSLESQPAPAPAPSSERVRSGPQPPSPCSVALAGAGAAAALVPAPRWSNASAFTLLTCCACDSGDAQCDYISKRRIHRRGVANLDLTCPRLKLLVHGLIRRVEPPFVVGQERRPPAPHEPHLTQL